MRYYHNEHKVRTKVTSFVLLVNHFVLLVVKKEGHLTEKEGGVGYQYKTRYTTNCLLRLSRTVT